MDETGVAMDWGAVAVIGLVLLGALVVYYVFVTRALIDMIRKNAPSVMLVFTYISLIPLPPFLVLGIVNLVVWHKARSDLPKA